MDGAFLRSQTEAEKIFLKKHAGNRLAEEFVANQRHERQLYHQYKDYYGYVFYIGKKDLDFNLKDCLSVLEQSFFRN